MLSLLAMYTLLEWTTLAYRYSVSTNSHPSLFAGLYCTISQIHRVPHPSKNKITSLRPLTYLKNIFVPLNENQKGMVHVTQADYGVSHCYFLCLVFLRTKNEGVYLQNLIF